MTDSLKNILSDRAKSNEPPEFTIIKRYVSKEFKVTPQLSVSSKNIIIGIPNSAVAGALKLSLHELQAKCKTDKKLVIRIQASSTE